jgi:hypothetical protein
MVTVAEDVQVRDIPKSVDDEISNGLLHYCVPLIGIKKLANDNDSFELAGTGTLVSVDGRGCILTAGHVWGFLKKWPLINLVLKSIGTRYVIDRNAISVQSIWETNDGEWGPDLALLALPLSEKAAISAHKSFLDLSARRNKMLSDPPNLKRGIWATVGSIAEFSAGTQVGPIIDYNVQARSCFGTVKDYHYRNGYDYIDLGVNPQLPGVPSSFGGMSGGGLWQLPLTKSRSDGQISWQGEKHFQGVVFWESLHNGQVEFVRCHGTRSLYDIAWRSWKLPE